jgi:uncharacterized caspase-like protein
MRRLFFILFTSLLLVPVAIQVWAQDEDEELWEGDSTQQMEHIDQESVTDLTADAQPWRKLKILAKENSWQDSGISVTKGTRYSITADGKWRAGVILPWVGPDKGGPDVLANIFFPPPVRDASATALIAKIGKEGEPFAVGTKFELLATATGRLYLRMNDSPGFTFDNDGEVDVTVALAGYVTSASPKTQTPRPVPSQSVTPPPATQTTLPKIRGQRWAVVIGISRYQDSRIPSLRYADVDARGFYDWLVSAQGGQYSPARVRLLLNADATANNIRDSLFNWLRQAIDEDIVTIYFAGHGSPDSPETPDNLYLLAHDTKYDNIAATGFPMWDIETAMQRFIKARRVIVMADACHSGGVGQSFDVARRNLSSMEARNRISSGFQSLSTIGDGVAVISASDDNQFSYEGEQFGGGHGVFTYFLLKGLHGDADYNRNQRVTLGELIPYLSENVRRATTNNQSPTIAGKFDPALSIAR